jgi:hypothetical protein
MGKLIKLIKTLKPTFLIFIIIFCEFGIYFVYRTDTPVLIKKFPDPFILNNGTRVQTEDQWQLRRTEIKELLSDILYGHMPGHPDNITALVIQSTDLGGGKTLNRTKLIMTPNDSKKNITISFMVDIYIPVGAGPFPTVVHVGKDKLDAQEELNVQIMERGYMYVCYDHTELDPDTEGYDVNGSCQKAYPNYDWGSIAVWAWGAMRVADYLLQESWVIADGSDGYPNVDKNILIIVGHSRGGKTALLAGAFDERFTMVVPSGSGCGGASSFLVQGFTSENIASITSPTRFKAWFQEDFGGYAWNEQNLPFDQHFLRALVAPRIILTTDGMGDFWVNPIGTQAIRNAAEPIFNFLNATVNNTIHYRAGGHGFTEEDCEVMLNLSDKLLLHKNVSGNFYMTPYNIRFHSELALVLWFSVELLIVGPFFLVQKYRKKKWSATIIVM